MRRERSPSPVRWKSSKPVYEYDHRQWETLVPNLYDQPGNWEGGIPAGNIAYSVNLSGKHDVNYSIRSKYLEATTLRFTFYKTVYEYDGERAYAAAKEFQRQFSLDHGLMVNRYRLIADNVVEMQLTSGKTTILDRDCLDDLVKYSWAAQATRQKGVIVAWYAMGASTNRSSQPMPNLIFGPHSGDRIDHRNGVTLDNRRQNLVSSSPASNMKNRRMNQTNKTGKNGVYRSVDEGRLYYSCTWRENGKNCSGKRYRYFKDDEESKTRAFESACREREEADLRTGTQNGIRPKRHP
jgi:hypothetical protein